jgi:ATP-dependent RNA circularization protein (DNA/RNA ligase family)
MGILETVSKVNITESLWNEAVEGHSIVPDEFDGVTYYRVVRRVGQLSKGVVRNRCRDHL